MLRETGASVGVDEGCLTLLASRENELRSTMKVGPPLERMLGADDTVWPKLRAQTARLQGPLVEKIYGQRRGTWFWILAEASCIDEDCKRILTRCEGSSGRCVVYPEAPHYDKMVPLPFGEYLPLGTTFPWLADYIKGPGDFRAGTEALVFEMGGARLATPICYEGILGYLCDDFDSPDLFLNLTNDAWFGETSASDLHGMLVAIRAVELGVPVFRSTYSGTSFVVEPHGEIYAETKIFEPSHQVVPVRMATFDTPYRRFGDWFVWLCMLILAAAGYRGRLAAVN
jgi:apolipoprotein N-acyltransferase